MEIGLLFGSFNPIHIGHLIIANSVLEAVNKVWFVISPQNPFKSDTSLADINFRFKLLQVAISDNVDFDVCEIELKMNVPSYTINTLNALKNEFPEHRFYIIMGSDNYLDLNKWKESSIIEEYPMFIYERPGFLLNEEKMPSHIKKLKTPLLNISSTEIREKIINKKSIRYLVPDKIMELISNMELY